MVDGSDQSIRNLKLILYCFEWLIGLKINYHKSEVFVFRVQKEEKERLANMLNCVLGKMPIKYLGIPVSNKHLNINAFSSLTQKLHKRLDPWRGKYLTSGGGKFSPIHALVASLYIVWVSTGLRMGCVTPLGVKHALTFQSMSISISYMFIITCNISSLELKCEKHWFEPKWLHLLARVVELV
jgi:hypothetical protein